MLSENTGVTDVILDPRDPDVIYAALWQAFRKEYTMSSGGTGSGMFKSTDGGENFTASHSPSFKGGWKPMDQGGGQLLEMAPLIADRVRELARQAAHDGLEIPLAPPGSR